jgi:hypothetical protein
LAHRRDLGICRTGKSFVVTVSQCQPAARRSSAASTGTFSSSFAACTIGYAGS